MSGITKAALAALALPALAVPAYAADQPAGALALKRVLLSTGGVGYFELEARVTGDAALTLEVRRDQVDDVLKSIVVYDDRGGVGTVDLPGQEPLESAFRELPFSADDLSSPTTLLNALKGAEIRVSGAREVSGRLLSVTEEAAQLPNGGGVVARHRVSVMTGDGLRQFVLEETDSLRFADPAVQAQLDKALGAVAGSAGKERRRLTIRATAPKTDSNGAAGAERTVRVAYVVAAPLWKATYRLTLPEAGARTGDLQGWAVLENLSGEDWNGVDLSVASGNPVTFRQALYNAYFVNRPEVPVEVLGRVLPKPDEGAMDATPMAKAEAAARPRASAEYAPPAAPPPVPPPAPMMAAPAMAAPFGGALAQRAAEPVAAESAEATAQVLFRYPQPVTLANGGTLMMPIVARAVPAERLDLYQPGTQPRHPLAAVRLTNDVGNGEAGGGLPPGVLTLYEKVGGTTAYVGDARLAPLPGGESRLLSFAVDQGVTVDRNEQPSRTLSRASLADGILQLTVTERQTTTYTVAGAARDDRTVIVEHPRRPGWDLVEPKGNAPETTESAYRLPVTVPAGKRASVTVALERPRVERIGLSDLSPEQVMAYAGSSELPPPVRDALGKVAALRGAVADKDRRVGEIEREQADIAKEQERLRQNLSTLPRDSDLFKRSIAKMGEQETRLDALSRDLGTARKEAEAARATLRDQVRAMKF